jgi:flagellar biosynthesis anti-sigma factor FlgM
MDIHLQSGVASPVNNTNPKKNLSEVNIEASSGKLSTSIGDSAESTRSEILLSQIAEQLLNESPVDENQVTRLTGQIHAGSYQIDPQRVANKMIELEQTLPDFS